MKVNVTQAIETYDDEPFQMTDGQGNVIETLTIRWAIRTALNTPLAQEPWTPESMLDCARISRAVSKDAVVDLDENDRVLIKARSAKVQATQQFGPMVHAALVDALSDPEPEPAAENPTP